MEGQKQVCDIRPSKGVTAADSREQTRAWSDQQKESRMDNPHLNYDFTRSHLNFEIVAGEIKELNKEESLQESIKNNLLRRGIPFPGEGKSHVKKGSNEPEKIGRPLCP